MLRGRDDEIRARELYSAKIARVEQTGFVTNDEWGFTLGASPDGLVGDYGLIECKSRKQRLQTETVARREIPIEHVLQVQTLLLVTGRVWCDYISYSGGMPMCILRDYADGAIQAAIEEAAAEAEDKIGAMMADYYTAVEMYP